MIIEIIKNVITLTVILYYTIKHSRHDYLNNEELIIRIIICSLI
jgi:hypothetical protein